MLTANEIRCRYLEFFFRHKHQIVTSGPIIPPNDPSLLFTNAGMVQFKKLFLGEEKRAYTRATTCQKCLRVSGKHNDLENVGRTARHHTFFEMLGNFSFGDYFKREAISWAWEFVTRELELPADKLWVTIFRDDDEAHAIWQEVAGLPEERIIRMGEKDNFWTMGDSGPCGPCSEIYIDQGEDMSCGPDCGIGKCDCDRFLEIWNLVFTQFDQAKDGSRSFLAAPNIDTGMGLERIAAVCQGKRSNFDCDLFQEIIQYAARLAKVTYSFSAPDTNDIDTALRVIADHSRAAAFLIAEGVLPSNENRGYVLRRLIRRALRFATLMGVHEPFLHKVAAKTSEIMGDIYPELAEHARFIEEAVHEEERRFANTLDTGLHLLDEELERLKAEGEKTISGDFCFKLYDTHGFPLDIVNDIAAKRDFSVDSAGFAKKMEEQRQRARASQKKDGLLGQGTENELAAICEKLAADGIKSQFVGYETLQAESKIAALLDIAGTPVKNLGEGGYGYLIAAQTPFYAESGGQAGDFGFIQTPTGRARVRDVIKAGQDLILHKIDVESGEMHLDDPASLRVDADTRQATARNHTCTHLLHASLRRILGKHVRQAGSMVDANRLRFDFSHLSALKPEELAAIEQDVNRAIMADFPVTASEMGIDEAKARGAMALFSEKYGDVVRVLKISGENGCTESMELCGGTHLSRTGHAGLFLITSSSSVSAGIRRIEAVTGWNAYNAAIGMRATIHEAAEQLKAAPDQICQRLRALQEEQKKLRKDSQKSSVSAQNGAELVAAAEKVGGVNLVCKKLDGMNMPALLGVMDDVRSRMAKESVACLAGNDNGKVSIILYVSKDLHGKFTAPTLIKDVAQACGGSGGGRPDLARAGGSKPEGLEKAFEILRNQLAGA